MLRELSAHITAEQVGNRAAEYRRTQGLEPAPIPEKVMVCLAPRWWERRSAPRLTCR